MTRVTASFVLLGHLVLVIGGCATTPQTTETPKPVDTTPLVDLKTILDGQEQWLRSLTIGQPIQELELPALVDDENDPASIVGIDFYYTVEISHDGRLYQYVRGTYPGTHVLYGLYFVDGELTSLLLEKDAWDFVSCESQFRAGRPPRRWDQEMPPYDIGRVNEWVRQRDRLGAEFDARLFHSRQPPIADAGQVDSGNAVEAIAHVPLAMMALPAYAVSFLPPVRWLIRMGDRAWERKRQRWANTARQIHPGSSTEEELRELMGRPLRRRDWRNGSEWQYEKGYDDRGASEFHFGIRDGLVVYKEIRGEWGDWTLEEPINPWTRFDVITVCGELQVPWLGR